MARQTVKKRAYWVVTLIALSIVGSRFYPSEQPAGDPKREQNNILKQNISSFLITTPNNARHPLHRVRIRPDDSLEVESIRFDDKRTTSSTPLFLTNLDSLDKSPPLIVSTNEKRDGELVRIDLRPDSDHAIISLVGSTGGDDPAFTRILQRNNRQIAMTVNYGSPILSIHDISDSTTTTPTIHRFYESPSESSHPHQVIPHPVLEDIFYMPDLGTNTIRVIRLLRVEVDGLNKVVDVQQLPLDRSTCIGPRHGVFTLDGKTLLIACQTSNTIVQLRVARSGYLTSDSSSPAFNTLPAATQDSHHHALSAIAISTSGVYLFVANRQVEGVYSRSLKDTTVVYRIDVNGNDLHRLGWVDLDCWQPREMLVLDARTTSQRLLVTCVGRGGPIEKAGAGLRLIDVEITEDVVKSKIVSRWDEESSWGVTGVAD